MNVLAIDQGTSSTKALVVSDEGEVLGEASVPVNPRSSAGGAVEQDPEELLESVIAAGTRALQRAGAEVRAVGLANQGETVLRWDRRSGRPYGPALSWQDRRAVSVTRELAARADRLTAVTGLPLDPYFAAPKMTWLRRNEGPEGVITTIDAWLNWRLTGAFVTDAATASRTMLLDLPTPPGRPRRARRSDSILRSSRWSWTAPSRSARPTPSAARCRSAGWSSISRRRCWPSPASPPGEAKCTYGTGAFVLANAGERPAASGSGLAACVAWRLQGDTVYCLDGQVYTAGAAVSGWSGSG